MTDKKAARLVVQFAHRLKELGIKSNTLTHERLESLRPVIEGKRLFVLVDLPCHCPDCGGKQAAAAICRCFSKPIKQMFKR